MPLLMTVSFKKDERDSVELAGKIPVQLNREQ